MNKKTLNTPQAYPLKKNNLSDNTLVKLKSSFTDTDIDLSLKNIGDNLELYVELIYRFHNKYSNLIEYLQKSIKEDSESTYIIHSLKSLVAILGRFNLQNAVINLEKTLIEKKEISSAFKIFENEFNYFIKEIELFFDK